MTTVLRAGPSPAQARLTTILVHGRGASAADIITLAPEIGGDDVAFVAPDAPGRTWYPYSFLVPMERNEPFLTQSLEILGRLVEELEAAGHRSHAASRSRAFHRVRASHWNSRRGTPRGTRP